MTSKTQPKANGAEMSTTAATAAATGQRRKGPEEAARQPTEEGRVQRAEPGVGSNSLVDAADRRASANNDAKSRSQKPRREEIERLKSFIPLTLAASAELDRLAEAQAPLASLDLSIGSGGAGPMTAPRDWSHCDRRPADASSSSVDTPSLSGYFDCDELSDMVDDSLFEITAAGCLSRSIFPRPHSGRNGSGAPSFSEPPLLPVTNQTFRAEALTMTQAPAAGKQRTTTTTTSRDDSSESAASGPQTPTNERTMEMAGGPEPRAPAPLDSERAETAQPGAHLSALKRQSRAGQEQQRQFVCTSQLAAGSHPQQQRQAQAHVSSIMAHVQSLDYSSTSSVPRQIRGSLSIASGHHNASHAANASRTLSMPLPAAANGAAKPNEAADGTKHRISRVQAELGQPGAAAVGAHQGCSAPMGRRQKRASAAHWTQSGPGAAVGELAPNSSDEDRARPPRQSSGAKSMAPSGRRAPGATKGAKCPVCLSEQQASGKKKIMNSGGGVKQANQMEGQKDRKRGFTSSLFSLFTGNSSDKKRHSATSPGDQNDDLAAQGQQQQQTCHLHKGARRASHEPSANGDRSMAPKRASLAGGASQTQPGKVKTANHKALKQRVARSTTGQAGNNPAAERRSSASLKEAGGRQDRPLPAMRLRDSIKITNQRKARSSADKRQQQQPIESGPEEILLDLSESTAQGGAKWDERQSSASSSTTTTTTTAGPKRVATHSSESSLVSATSSSNSLQQRQQQQRAPAAARHNKCVKFTTPDRVLILSPEPPQASNLQQGLARVRRSQAQSSSSSNLLSGQQPTPIMKRTLVPKSSSYSQTEPNKGLDELLARYERNNQLVAEINEKLRLTETIASNLSTLDQEQQQQQQASEAPKSLDEQNGRGAPTRANQLGASDKDDEAPSEEFSIDEDDLARRRLEIIEASRVFTWRPEDELNHDAEQGASQELAAPAPSSSSSSTTMAVRVEDEEERLEREAASRCECNLRTQNDLMSSEDCEPAAARRSELKR